MSTSSAHPRALILDFGEVMVHAQDALAAEAMARAAGLSRDEFRKRYWAYRDEYDAGLPASTYWGKVLESDPDVDARRIDELIALDCVSWTKYRDEMWELASAFRARGGRTAMLSNGVPEIVAKVRGERPLEDYFDVVIVSYDVGLSKPDLRIYRLCLDRVAVPAGESLFVDDREVNLRAAEAQGIHTLHFTGDASVPALRSRLGF